VIGSRDNFLDRIEKRNGFLIDQRFDPTRLGPKTADVDGRRYYRFMDYIYIPKPPQRLSPDEVMAVCDLRIEMFDRVVNKSLNQLVMSSMVDAVRRRFATTPPDPLMALDFGCGPGFSAALFREGWGPCEITGVDLSSKAIEVARRGGLQADVVSYGGRLPFEAATFDVVLASFVLHFHIESASLAEIRRVLSEEGIFVFNVYNETPDGLWESLRRARFASSCSCLLGTLPGTHRVYSALPC
jgi:ubiquinone/menaquinone biosynthesis C-methylase UbiE